MEPTSAPPRYTTIRDYIRVLRRYWYLIVIIGAIGAVAGYADGKRQKPVYQAAATVSFQDPSQDLTLVGLGTAAAQTPQEIAAQNAETLNRPQIMNLVARRLKIKTASNALASSVSSQITQAGLLTITATSPQPAFAKRLANAVANVLVDQQNQAARAGFTSAARDVRHQISAVRARSRSTSQDASVEVEIYEQELARLETLAKFAQNAQVAQVAHRPGAPVASNTKRNTILGLVLGLLLAIAVAFIRDSMDRHIRTRAEAEGAFHLPILGHVREEAMGKVVHVGGGDRESDLDFEAARIVRRNLEALPADGAPRSIVVTSAVPEEGKTTVASGLALAMASAGRRTLLVDCDLRHPALANRLKVAASPGMTDFLSGHADPQDIVRVVAVGGSKSKRKATQSNGSSVGGSLLACIPAGSPSSRSTEMLGSERFRTFLEEVTRAYDVVILDSSPLLPVADTLEMLPFVDAVVLCARERRTTREQARAAAAAIARFPQRPAGVVMTGVRPRSSEYEVYEYAYSAANVTSRSSPA